MNWLKEIPHNKIAATIFDGFGKSRHSRENRNPDHLERFDITGLSFKTENDGKWFFPTFEEKERGSTFCYVATIMHTQPKLEKNMDSTTIMLPPDLKIRASNQEKK